VRLIGSHSRLTSKPSYILNVLRIGVGVKVNDNRADKFPIGRSDRKSLDRRETDAQLVEVLICER